MTKILWAIVLFFLVYLSAVSTYFVIIPKRDLPGYRFEMGGTHFQVMIVGMDHKIKVEP